MRAFVGGAHYDFFFLPMFISLTDFVVRVGVALILGSLIGAEREWRNKLAGLKTNALVCVGSALFTCIGFYAGAASEYADPTRIAAQIASGIGFLGAGVIMRDGMNIRGLTTAATVWCAAAVGTMAGAGLLIPSVVGTCFIFGSNLLLKEITRAMMHYRNLDAFVELNYELNFRTDELEYTTRKDVLAFFKQRNLTVRALDVQPTAQGFAWTAQVQSMVEKEDDGNPEVISDAFWKEFAIPLNWKIL